MEPLLDTSWTLHYTSTNSPSYRKLFTPSTTAAHLARYFDKLPQFLASQKPQLVDDLNDATDKIGSLRDCKYSVSSLQSHQPTINSIQLVSITLQYQHSAFPFILTTPHLILSKAPISHTKLITNFLSDTFNVSFDPLKLPSTLLSTSLQNYISTLSSPFSPNDGGNGDPAPEKRAAVLKAAIGTLKLTISFSGPVAPHLRTLDLSIPYDTVDTLQSAVSTGGDGFLDGLAHHIHLQTGLKLPLTVTAQNGDGGSHVTQDTSTSEPPLKLSKVAAAAFALSVDGRVRFAAKAIEHAVESEELVIQANIQLLEGIINEAKRRGTVAKNA